jgi:lipopolysaccharide biosynthesis protein
MLKLLGSQFLLCANKFSSETGITLVPRSILEDLNSIKPIHGTIFDNLHSTKFAIHLHAHYLDIAEIILSRILHSCPNADVIVTYSDPLVKEGLAGYFSILKEKIRKPRHVEFYYTPNRGRNVKALLDIGFGKILDYPLVLHLHTKKSPHTAEGTRWMNDLLKNLAADVHHVDTILYSFQSNQRLGLLIPKPFDGIRPYLGWGANYRIAKKLAAEFSPPINICSSNPLVFPAGMMFWCRPIVLKELSKAYLNHDHEVFEPLPQDGSILHAIERLIVFACENKGYHWRFVSYQNRTNAFLRQLNPPLSVNRRYGGIYLVTLLSMNVVEKMALALKLFKPRRLLSYWIGLCSQSGVSR